MFFNLHIHILENILDLNKKLANFSNFTTCQEINNIQFYCNLWMGKMESEVMLFPRLSDNRRHRRNHHKEEEEESKAAVREGPSSVK